MREKQNHGIFTVTALLLSLVLLTAAFAGCTGAIEASAAPAASEDPALPIPDPEGMKKVFGRDITAALLGTDAEFIRGAEAQAQELGIPTVQVATEAEANEYDLVIACACGAEHGCDAALLTKPAILLYCGEEPRETATAEATESPAPTPAPQDTAGVTPTATPVPTPSVEELILAGMTMQKPDIAENCRYIFYNWREELCLALDALYHYPSHEAPIRMLALYSEATPTQLCTEELEQQGKLWVRGSLKGDPTGTDGMAQIGKLLEDIVPGQLDTLLSETPEWAMEAYRALKNAARSDTAEVITRGISQEIYDAMCEDHFLMGAAVGLDEYGAGRLALRMGVNLLAGESVENIELAPVTLYSEQAVKLFLEEGISDVSTALVKLTGGYADRYETEAVRYLREYYGASASETSIY